MESTGKENTPIIFTHKINPKILPMKLQHLPSALIHASSMWKFGIFVKPRPDKLLKVSEPILNANSGPCWFWNALRYYNYICIYITRLSVAKIMFFFQGISSMCPYAIPDHMCILIAIVFNNWSYAFSDSPTIVLYFQDKCALWRFYTGKNWTKIKSKCNV